MKKWYSAHSNGKIEYVGEFKSFEEADKALEDSVSDYFMYIWLIDEEKARTWNNQLTELLA